MQIERHVIDLGASIERHYYIVTHNDATYRRELAGNIVTGWYREDGVVLLPASNSSKLEQLFEEAHGRPNSRHTN